MGIETTGRSSFMFAVKQRTQHVAMERNDNANGTVKKADIC